MEAAEALQIAPKRFNWPYLCAFAATVLLSCMQAGYCLGGCSFVQSIFQVQSTWTQADQTLITSSATFGLAVGSLCSGSLLSKGRRKTILIGNVIVLVSFALQMKISAWLLSIGKFMQGLGSGLILSSTSVMVAETVPTKLMGGFGSLINLGIVLAISTYMFLFQCIPTDEASLMTTQIWRWLFALPVFNSLIMFVLFFTIFREETILFLIKKGNRETALSVIKRIYQPVTEDTHDAILNELIEVTRNENKSTLSFKRVLTDPQFSKATWVAIYLCAANQLTGITGISQYSLQIFTILDEHGAAITPAKGAFLLGIVALLGAFVSIGTSAYFGFKTQFAGGYLLQALMLIGCIIGLTQGLPKLMLTCLMIYFFIFNVTIGAITYPYIARTTEDAGLSLANMTLWMSSLLIALLTQTLFNALTPSGTFALYGLNDLIAGIFCVIYLKEITGLDSDQAKAVYRKSQLSVSVLNSSLFSPGAEGKLNDTRTTESSSPATECQSPTSFQ